VEALVKERLFQQPINILDYSTGNSGTIKRLIERLNLPVENLFLSNVESDKFRVSASDKIHLVTTEPNTAPKIDAKIDLVLINCVLLFVDEEKGPQLIHDLEQLLSDQGLIIITETASISDEQSKSLRIYKESLKISSTGNPQRSLLVLNGNKPHVFQTEKDLSSLIAEEPSVKLILGSSRE
jgi:hypothetical protein